MNTNNSSGGGTSIFTFIFILILSLTLYLFWRPETTFFPYADVRHYHCKWRRWGCCPDYLTPKLDQEGSNCIPKKKLHDSPKPNPRLISQLSNKV
jgi:hypothetical protein